MDNIAVEIRNNANLNLQDMVLHVKQSLWLQVAINITFPGMITKQRFWTKACDLMC